MAAPITIFNMWGSQSKYHIYMLILICFLIQFELVNAKDKYTEELLIKPLDSGHVYFQFQFTTQWDADIADSNSFKHYRLFPKALGDVLVTYKVQELHLSMTQGLWRAEKWGYPVIDSPPGAELWVWFQPTVQNLDATWAGLVNALSGLFCASLNFVDIKSTVSPKLSFKPRGVAPPGYSKSYWLMRYAALPNELVCTENLTPWKKLLPSNSKVGLATLFNAIKLYDASYHSLGVHIRPVCKDSSCSSSAVELSQSLSVVYNPVPSGGYFQNWSLRNIFGRVLQNHCPLSEVTHIYVDITGNSTSSNTFKLTPAPDSVVNFKRGEADVAYAIYDLALQTQSNAKFNLAAKYTYPHSYTSLSLPPIHAHRFITGYGLEKGGIMCQIQNTLSSPLTIIYLDIIPWYMRIYYNSLTVETHGRAITPAKIYYTPGNDRGRPYQLETVLILPANSLTKISYQFERAFLKWTEYPPDANHGFYANSAVITAILPSGTQYTAPPMHSSFIGHSFHDNSTEFFLRLHTETLLVSLPTPDFSMPYNVICLACTVVAIAFGSVHNLTTRQFEAVDPEKNIGLLGKVKNFLTWKRKSDVKKDGSASESQDRADDSSTHDDNVR